MVVECGNKKPYGVAVLDEDKIVVCDYNAAKLDVICTVTGKIEKSFNVGEYPYGVAVDPNTKNIWLAKSTKKQVTCLTQDGAFVNSFNTANQPLGIAILPNGNIAVSCNVDNENICGAVYTPYGGVVFKLKAVHCAGQDCRDVKYYNKELYVTICMNIISGKVLVFSASDGSFVRFFCENIGWCNGLAIATDGHIILSEADPLHRISVWSPTGTRMRDWGNNKIFDYPFHLTILPNGQIVVTNTGGLKKSGGRINIIS